jgi:hypothetical protein
MSLHIGTDVFQLMGGLVSLIASGWLLFDVSTDFAALGSLLADAKMTDDKAGRVAIGNIAFRYMGKMIVAWVLAILAGVLLS